MELSKVTDHSDILLTGKNVLSEQVIDKYRLTGQISQTCLKYVISLIHDSYHRKTVNPPLIPSEICFLGDSYMQKSLKAAYQKSVTEKGIAHPVSLDINNIANGNSPEITSSTTSNPLNRPLQVGDIVKITLGAQIDGYTAMVSHTVVIYPTENNPTVPDGPLLGSKADSICASYIATEAVISLLGCVNSPEKLKAVTNNTVSDGVVTGKIIRDVVDSIATSFHCVVAPGSKVRRIRRFLAGQAENIVAEKDFKGVVWAEAHQEYQLLQTSKKLASNSADEMSLVVSTVDNKSAETFDKLGISDSSAIPTDNFSVKIGEAYMIDIKMASTQEFQEPGLITLQNIDNYSGKNHNKNEIIAHSDVYIRDFAISHNLKLKNSRLVLSKVDNLASVYPFKLSYLNDDFTPKKKLTTIEEQREHMRSLITDTNKFKLGLNECINHHLIVEKKIQSGKFIPLRVILNGFNEIEKPNHSDLTLMHNTLPGFEIPLPKLGITQLKLKTFMKHALDVNISRELSTVLLTEGQILRLTGSTKNFPCNWVHSNYKLEDEGILNLIKLSQDQRFGIKIKECQPMKLSDIKNPSENDDGDKMEIS